MTLNVWGGLTALGGGVVGYIIPFLFVLTIVVFFHELGHFLIARWCGIRVQVFSIGFGPELFGFFDRHRTRWKISAIPLGGYVKFLGDENAASVPDRAAVEGMTEAEKKESFIHKSVGARSAEFYLRTGYMPLQSPDDQPRRTRVLFTEQQIRALVAYVASLGGGPPIPRPHPERGSLSEGMHLFTTNCAGCHQVVAEGGYVTGARVPPLEDATPTQIAQAVRIGPYLMPRFSEQDLSDRELDSIVRYVEYAKHPEDPGGWALGHLGPFPEGLVTWLVAGSALVAVCLLLGRRGTSP